MPLQQLEAAGAWLGRLLLAAIFLHEAWAKLTAYDAAVGYMQAFDYLVWLLPFAIAVELVGGILVVRVCTRVSALALALFCVATAVLFHNKFGDHNELLISKDLHRGRVPCWRARRRAWALTQRSTCMIPKVGAGFRKDLSSKAC